MAANYGAPVVHAGFWLRTAAYLIDTAILVILGIAIGIGSSFAGEMGMLIGNIAYLLISLLYWPVMESSARRATFGKSVVGIEVTDLNGKRLTFLRALLRNLAKIISAIPLFIGYLLAAFTGRKQALHDMITKCLVVRTGPSHVFKAVAAAVGALAIAIGGGGAYFYYVIMPTAQNEIGEEMQAAMQAAVKPKPSPPVTAVEPGPASAPVVAAAPKPPVVAPKVPAPAMQPGKIVTSPEATVEQIPEPVPPAPEARKSAPEKTAKKSVKQPDAVKMLEPMDSKAGTPEMSQPASPSASEVLPKHPPVVTYAPDSESRVIRPKYNDVMTAVLRGDRDAVKQLLDLGWWVEKPGLDGLTPLVAAVMNRDTQMVQVLLNHGAVPSSQALKIAREKKDTATATLLEQYGAH